MEKLSVEEEKRIIHTLEKKIMSKIEVLVVTAVVVILAFIAVTMFAGSVLTGGGVGELSPQSAL